MQYLLTLTQNLTWMSENSGTESLTELLSTIAQRLGADFDISKLPQQIRVIFHSHDSFACSLNLLSDVLSHINIGMQYEDDEGDLVILATDNDLVNAINCAKSSGLKVRRFHAPLVVIDWCVINNAKSSSTTV